MITGFNTDIVYQGVTYHVQTEDKGLTTPLILSLVYDRGTILASKRSPYNDLLGGEFDEKELAGRLQKQHTLICAAIRGGRIEDLKRMTMKESAAKRKGLVAQKEIKPESREKSVHLPDTKKGEEIPVPQILAEDARPVEKTIAKKAAPKLEFNSNSVATAEDVWEIPITIIEEPIADAPFIEEEIILPAEAVEIIGDSIKNEPVRENLKVELLNDITFKGGERKTLSVMVKRGSAESGVGAANVMVKIIGSSFRPAIFHAKTDSNGVAVVNLELPRFRTGRAVVLVRATSGDEETELRRVIQQG